MNKLELKKKDKDTAIELLVLAVKVIKPNMTDEEAENIIVNVGNMIQLRRIEKELPLKK